jgi:hypothetical protein
MPEPDNLVLHHLRSIDTKLDLVRADMHDLKVRTTQVEEGLAGVNRRLDRADERWDRIEKRIGLVDV